MPQTKPTTIRFISLGCPKNLVDSEVMAGTMNQGLFTLVPHDQPSDVCVINTCGFIEDSKKESIQTILEISQEKKEGKLKALVVAGCLSQRYQNDLPKLLPEVDAFIGTADFSRLPQIVSQKLKGEKKRDFILDPSELMTKATPRVASNRPYRRYVKISEGCSHRCSFCTIPLMRGNLKSRALDDVISEMRRGVDEGVKEFNLIAQDLNEYGRDRFGLSPQKENLYELLKQLGTLEGDFWIRLLYMYPLGFPDRLIRLMADHPHICPYVDIPFQHIDDKILKLMNRGSSAKYIYRLIENLRKQIPKIVLRTTFITGFPGEGEKEFKTLVGFIKETEFDNVGVFTYSHEEDTPSYAMPNQVPQKVKEERKQQLMQLQKKISAKKLARFKGQTLKVLYEGNGTGRFYGQAPDIDGQVLIQGEEEKTSGTFLPIKITKTTNYDLVGEISN